MLSVDLPGQLAAASKNIKIAISRINYGWNLQNAPIFGLPEHLILRVFEHLQGLAYENPSKTHSKWWTWLNVASVCRTWWKISMEGSSLWEDVHIVYKMPVSFLGLIMDRAGGRQLTVHFQSSDYLHSVIRREGYLRTIQSIADRIKSFTIHITPSGWYRGFGRGYLSELLAIPYPNLESFDLSQGPFYPLSSWGSQDPGYRPDLSEVKDTGILDLFASIPTGQLSHLTLRHTKGWPPARFGNLTNLTLFGYADGIALAGAVPANPALRKLKLESIKHKERYSYDPGRLVALDGQTLELDRCERGVLSMFTLSSTCSLVITKTMDQNTIAYEGDVPELLWLPDDISEVRCLHELEELHFSVTRIPRKGSWVAAEQKTVGYSTSNPTSGSGPAPSVTFALTYHYGTWAPLYDSEVPFQSKYLLPHPTPWGPVTRASFDGFYGNFKIHDNTTLKTLQNLRSLLLRRCDSGHLVHSITPDEFRGLESLRFEDELSGVDFGGTLSDAFKLRHVPAGYGSTT